MAICRNCSQEIDWIRTQAGNLLPADPVPIFVIEGAGHDGFVTDEGEMVAGRQAAPEEEHNGLMVAFSLHRRTCPERDRRGHS